MLLAAVAAMFLAGMTVRADEKVDWAQFSRYAQDNAELSAVPDSGRLVVFMGNSITDCWASMRPEFFADNGFVGRGISGQTSYQMLSRFRRDVIDLHPKAVVINAGTNDIAENTHPYNEDITFGNIQSMVEIARANGVEVILTSILPAGGFKWRRDITDSAEKIAALNNRLKAYAEANTLTYVDYHSALLAADGRNLDARYTKDGVHPTVPGYEVMEGVLLPLLRKVVP